MPRKPKPTNGTAWTKLWRGIRELNEQFDNRLVFIGGVSVYLHVSQSNPEFVEFSHDGDFYISIADFSELRDTDDVTETERLKKFQIVKHGIDYDIYVERRHGLLVTYEHIEAASVIFQNVKVVGIDDRVNARAASVEHLLILKLAAYSDRKGRKKGEKDERDLIRLGYLLRNGVNHSLLHPYLTKEMVELLAGIVSSSQFIEVSKGNPHYASRLRDNFKAAVRNIASGTQWSAFLPRT